MEPTDSPVPEWSPRAIFKRLGPTKTIVFVLLLGIAVFSMMGLAEFIWQCVFLIGSGCDL